MKITRRNFVQSLGTVAAVAFSGATARSAFGSERAGIIPSPKGLLAMKESQVRDLIGRSFIATASDGKSIEMVLAEVNGVGRTANLRRGYAGECFSAIFKTRRKADLDQGIYEIKGAATDQFTALLVPTGRRKREYEMLVNHTTR